MKNFFINFSYSKIEFDKILNDIAKYAYSDFAKNEILNITILNDYEKIIFYHKLIYQLRNFLITEERLSINIIFNFEKQIIEASKSIVIDEISLYRLAYSVQLYFDLRKKFNNPKYPDLIKIFKIENLDSAFYKDILKYINEDGYIDSKASKELNRIRLEIFSLESDLKRSIDSFFKKMKADNWTVDDIISVKDGFPCVAIKAVYKNKIEGIIIDSSSTGQTVYAVPNSVLKMHNEIFFLKEEEKKEITRILKNYTDEVKNNYNQLLVIDKDLIYFDILFAKTRYASDFNFNSPEIINEKRINIINAKHPLLGKNAVPLDLKIGDNFSILIITGPNTGGKTVVLKTIGLFVLMVQSGIPIPASSSSQFCIFDKVFFVIGDEQSIEESLSSFSAHIKKINEILNNADDKSLILLDEFCSGTDPIEGASLAQSIIEELLIYKSIGIITTHYSSLKIFANNKENIENACMEFDNDKLIPTYKLLIGVPGSSKAFEISKRLGLKESIIENAKKNINSEYLNIEKLTGKLNNDINQNLILKDQLLKEKNNFDDEKEKFIKEKEELFAKEKEIKNMLKIKESSFLKEARKEFENLIKKIKTENASKESIMESKSFIQVIDDKVKEYQIDNNDNENININYQFKKGDDVLIISKNIKGTIIDKSNINNQFIVQAGFVKMNFDISDLKLIKENKNFNEDNINYSYDAPKKQITLNIRGLKYEEAYKKIEKFIEESITNHIKTVKVIHGLGTGALRKCIHDYCESSSYIIDYKYEKTSDSNSTNFGVTVITLK